jgi:hypothetical protein
MPSEELLKKKKHLKSLEDFLESPAYNGFIIGIEEEIKQMNAVILENFPMDVSDVFEQCSVRGQKECLESMRHRFKNAADELRDMISDMEDEEITGKKGGR